MSLPLAGVIGLGGISGIKKKIHNAVKAAPLTTGISPEDNLLQSDWIKGGSMQQPDLLS